MDELTKEDVDLFYKCAHQGIADAQFILGVCYLNGHYVEEDPEMAFEWFMKAAEQGHPEAQEIIADLEEEIAREQARENLRRKQKSMYSTEEPFEGASQVPLLEDLTEEQRTEGQRHVYENDYLYHKMMFEGDDELSDERIAFLDSLDW